MQPIATEYEVKLAMHQPQYMPWIGYFHKVDFVDVFVFQDDVQYKHREYQNANTIKTAHGSLKLTVPVLTHGRREQLQNKVYIDDTQNWRYKHWRSLVHSYRKAPYFKQFKSFFENVYARNWQRLIELNLHIIEFILNELGITTPILIESEIDTGGKTGEDRIIAVCQSLGAETYLSGAGGKDWMDHKKFKVAGIQLEFQKFQHPVYPQVYGGFIPYLSVIDLMFNAGPKAIKIIRGVCS